MDRNGPNYLFLLSFINSVSGTRVSADTLPDSLADTKFDRADPGRLAPTAAGM